MSPWSPSPSTATSGRASPRVGRRPRPRGRRALRARRGAPELDGTARYRPRGRPRRGRRHREVRRLPRDVRGFVDPETTIPATDVGPADAPTGDAELEAVIDALADADLDAYAARLTTRDVEQAGFEAVRVLVPEAQPLFVSQSFFGQRARDVPRELGFQARLDRPFHPFPIGPFALRAGFASPRQKLRQKHSSLASLRSFAE